MRQENVTYFTDKEEEFITLLIEAGTKKYVAKVLVFLAKTPKATSRKIEHGTDLRQPEISIATRYLMDQGWIRSRESSSEKKGRHEKIYALSKSIDEITDCILNVKKNNATPQLAIVQKLRDYSRYSSLIPCICWQISMVAGELLLPTQ